MVDYDISEMQVGLSNHEKAPIEAINYDLIVNELSPIPSRGFMQDILLPIVVICLVLSCIIYACSTYYRNVKNNNQGRSSI